MVFVFPSPITQKWWDPQRESLFGFVFKFCFHHSILWFFSDELWKLKTHFRCFQVMETKLWWHFCKYTHNEGPINCNFWLHSPLFFFFLLHFSFFFFNLLFLSFFFFLFAFLIPVRFFFLLFRLSHLNSFFFPPFSSHFDQVLRYGSHKKLKYLSDVKWKQCAKRVGFRKLGYFKWWVMSDEWRKFSKEWGVMVFKKTK